MGVGFATCASLRRAVLVVNSLQDSLEVSTGDPSVITSSRGVELG